MKKKINRYISSPHAFEIPLNKKNFYPYKKKFIHDFSMNAFIKDILFHYTDIIETDKSERSIAEKILAVFKNPELMLGPKENLENNYDTFIAHLNYFILKSEPILFTITQFAFKIPNPLKVSRIAPDAGELAYLSELFDITQLIKRIYPPGAKIMILEEGYIFNNIIGVAPKNVDIYFQNLQRWIKKLEWDNTLFLYNLKELEKQVNFQKEYRKNLLVLKNNWKKKDEKTVAEVNAVSPTLFLSLNTRKYGIKTMMNFYSTKVTQNPRINNLRKKLQNKALNKSIYYLAHVKTLDASNIVKKLFPNHLTLISSFTPGKLCIYPINKESKLYPYHGVPFLLNNGKIKIMYEVDIKRIQGITAYFINNETTPFFYSEIAI